MTNRPHRIALALVFVLSAAAASLAQTPFTPIPSSVSTAGGTVVWAKFVPTLYYAITATVDGVSAPIANAGSQGYWIVAPPHPPGTATVVVTASDVTPAAIYSATISYIDLPQIGLASPVAVVSRGSHDEQSVRGSNASGSDSAASSADGRFVVFSSDSRFPEFPAVSSNRYLYYKDLLTGELKRILACLYECKPSISADGSRVAAWYYNTTGSHAIVLLEAPFTEPPIRLDLDSSGNPPPASNQSAVAISGNGRFVVFATPANLDGSSTDSASSTDIFVRDLDLAVTERWTTGLSTLVSPSISADGRHISFATTAALAPEDTNATGDVYLLDRQASTFRCITASANAASTGGIVSGDGSTVIFGSAASNLVPDDTNSVSDVFAFDVATGAVTRVSVTSAGAQISTVAAPAPRWASSANGKRVAFTSAARELTSAPLPPGMAGVYVHDRTTGQTVLVNSDAGGIVASPAAPVSLSGGVSPAVTPDGRAVTFSTLAQNLVPDDTNGVIDVFRKELPADTPTGSDVPAEPVDPATGETPVGLVFDNVTVPGDTSVTVSDTGPALPSGFQLGSQYLDIQTTAVFSGAIRVCADYDPATTSDPAALQLLHYEGGAWVNITTGYDPVTHQVCGETTSLSPFVLATPPPLSVRSLLEDGRVFKAGSTIPIRVQILDGSGANVSAAGLPLVATGVRLVSTQTDWAVPEDPGQSNPDLGFTFTDGEGAPGYRFNLKTTGLGAGTYALRFTVGAGGPTLSVEFQVR